MGFGILEPPRYVEIKKGTRWRPFFIAVEARFCSRIGVGHLATILLEVSDLQNLVRKVSDTFVYSQIDIRAKFLYF